MRKNKLTFVKCGHCGKSFKRSRGWINQNKKRKLKMYCSRFCMGLGRGKRPFTLLTVKCDYCGVIFIKSLEHINYNTKYHKKIYCSNSCSGKVRSEETRNKMSLKMRGKNNPFYIDGRTPENKRTRRSFKYAAWRMSVFKRDNYICQICDKRGGKIVADHIKPFCKCSNSEKYDISNGRVLCHECHLKTPTYGSKALSYNPTPD